MNMNNYSFSTSIGFKNCMLSLLSSESYCAAVLGSGCEKMGVPLDLELGPFV
jgi:hypothetical protein